MLDNPGWERLYVQDKPKRMPVLSWAGTEERRRQPGMVLRNIKEDSMAKNDDGALLARKAKDYFEQGYN